MAVFRVKKSAGFTVMSNHHLRNKELSLKAKGLLSQISNHQLSYVTHSGEGEGLLFYGSTILPFIDRFPKDTKLYAIMTTKLQEQKSEK